MALDPERRSMGTSKCHLNTSCGLINRGWVAWVKVYDVERPETPHDPRNITDDVFSCISRCIVINNIIPVMS